MYGSITTSDILGQTRTVQTVTFPTTTSGTNVTYLLSIKLAAVNNTNTTSAQIGIGYSIKSLCYVTDVGVVTLISSAIYNNFTNLSGASFSITTGTSTISINVTGVSPNAINWISSVKTLVSPLSSNNFP